MSLIKITNVENGVITMEGVVQLLNVIYWDNVDPLSARMMLDGDLIHMTQRDSVRENLYIVSQTFTAEQARAHLRVLIENMVLVGEPELTQAQRDYEDN